MAGPKASGSLFRFVTPAPRLHLIRRHQCGHLQPIRSLVHRARTLVLRDRTARFALQDGG